MPANFAWQPSIVPDGSPWRRLLGSYDSEGIQRKLLQILEQAGIFTCRFVM